MEGGKRIKFNFRIELQSVIDNESPGKDDESTIRSIKQLVTEFLKDPMIRNSFYLESLLGLFAGSGLYDIIKKAFKIKEDEKEHFLPLARKCDREVKDFIFGLFKPDGPGPKSENESNIVFIDPDREFCDKYEGLDLLYARFSPLQITGLRFCEETPDGMAVETRLMPNGRWQMTSYSSYKGFGIDKNDKEEEKCTQKTSFLGGLLKKLKNINH